MLTQEEDVEIHALKQAWSIAAIARRTGRDRRTVRAYLSGQRVGLVRIQLPTESERSAIIIDHVETRNRAKLRRARGGAAAAPTEAVTLATPTHYISGVGMSS